jgi:hypothetical protein
MPSPRRYSIEEANALIPQVRAVILQVAVEQRRLADLHAAIRRFQAGNGDPGAAASANRLEQQATQLEDEMRSLLEVLSRMDVQLRDIETGLVDFPGERDGHDVWLCWRLADPSVAFWHGTDEGYASRKPW